jgi:hypothetical protein
MRHPHGLRAAAGNQGLVLPAIGDAFEGGFYAGLISHTANSVATHALIVAPRSTGATGTGYTLTTNKQWKTSNTTTAGTTSTFNGAANTANMSGGAHPAADFCTGLSIGGYSDWYFPARYELDIAYYNLKPTTAINTTGFGINPYSVPERTSNYSGGIPARTSIAAFQSGGSQAFVDSYHWSSTEFDSDQAWGFDFSTGDQSESVFFQFDEKTDSIPVRAFRKIAL